MDFILRGKAFCLTFDEVVALMRGVPPEPVHRYVVKVGRRVYPPKQVLARITGFSRLEITTQDSCRVLNRLGFSVLLVEEAGPR